jgi:hypothetical protein
VTARRVVGPLMVAIALGGCGATNAVTRTRTTTRTIVQRRGKTRTRIVKQRAPAPLARTVTVTSTVTRTITTSASLPSSSAASQGIEGPGSSSHSTDAQFCATHQCIRNFPNGNGTIVQCVDGEWSHSGGLSGACSDHGGEA